MCQMANDVLRLPFRGQTSPDRGCESAAPTAALFEQCQQLAKTRRHELPARQFFRRKMPFVRLRSCREDCLMKCTAALRMTAALVVRRMKPEHHMATWKPDPSFYPSPRMAAKAAPETV